MKTSDIVASLGKGVGIGFGSGCAFAGATNLGIQTIKYCMGTADSSVSHDFFTTMTTFLMGAFAGAAVSTAAFIMNKANSSKPNDDKTEEEHLTTYHTL